MERLVGKIMQARTSLLWLTASPYPSVSLILWVVLVSLSICPFADKSIKDQASGKTHL